MRVSFQKLPNQAATGVGGPAPVRELTRLVLHKVRADIRHDRRPGRDTSAGVRNACDEARAQGLQVEDLLIIVKQCWRDLSDVEWLDGHDADVLASSFARHVRSDEVLSEVITLCIREFYRTSQDAQ